jgi:aquaporin Z
VGGALAGAVYRAVLERDEAEPDVAGRPTGK